jgi:hypothetical protein
MVNLCVTYFYHLVLIEQIWLWVLYVSSCSLSLLYLLFSHRLGYNHSGWYSRQCWSACIWLWESLFCMKVETDGDDVVKWLVSRFWRSLLDRCLNFLLIELFVCPLYGISVYNTHFLLSSIGFSHGIDVNETVLSFPLKYRLNPIRTWISIEQNRVAIGLTRLSYFNKFNR